MRRNPTCDPLLLPASRSFSWSCFRLILCTVLNFLQWKWDLRNSKNIFQRFPRKYQFIFSRLWLMKTWHFLVDMGGSFRLRELSAGWKTSWGQGQHGSVGKCIPTGTQEGLGELPGTRVFSASALKLIWCSLNSSWSNVVLLHLDINTKSFWFNTLKNHEAATLNRKELF